MTPDPEGLIAAIVDGAEVVCDPLDGLVERVGENPGAPFEPDVLERLCELKNENLAEFERLRVRLKGAGCRVTALDEAMSCMSGNGGRAPNQADILIGLAAEAFLFHSADGVCSGDIRVDGHRETWPLRSKGFRLWLIQKFFEQTEGAPCSESLQAALNVLEAKAHFDGPQLDVHVRVASEGDKLYLDLADDEWRAVEIDADGWRIVDEPLVRFRRPAGMLPLRAPVPGGSIEPLRSFLNVASEGDFVLAVAWMLAVLRDPGPYPVLALTGEQGSAKSTLSEILRKLLDPNAAPLRALPRNDRDLFIAATNGHVLSFDNVSGLPPWTSDTLCRLATGAGFATRQLYTDTDEVLFDAARPVVLNGIEDMVARPDLADRSIFLTLRAIAEERRRPEKELMEEFEQVRPQILGALLDAVSYGLKRLPDTRLERLPRMADFALWVTACEGALWEEGSFGRAYSGNRDDAIDTVIDADPVASAVRLLMGSRDEWTGTATDLLSTLSDHVGDSVSRSKAWPQSARALSGRLRRAATPLRATGVDVQFDRKEGRGRTRTINISRAPEDDAQPPSAPSASQAPAGTAAPRDNGTDAADGGDADISPESGGWSARI